MEYILHILTHYWIHIAHTEYIDTLLNTYCTYWTDRHTTKYILHILNIWIHYWIHIAHTDTLLNTYSTYWTYGYTTEYILHILNTRTHFEVNWTELIVHHSTQHTCYRTSGTQLLYWHCINLIACSIKFTKLKKYWIMHELLWIMIFGSWVKLFTSANHWQIPSWVTPKIVIHGNECIILFLTCYIMSWTHNFTKNNYQSWMWGTGIVTSYSLVVLACANWHKGSLH